MKIIYIYSSVAVCVDSPVEVVRNGTEWQI